VERARTGAPPAVVVCNPGAALATAWEPAGRYFARMRAAAAGTAADDAATAADLTDALTARR
jgi:hypothetical protein